MATKSVTFRCPDELLDYIQRQVDKTGVDRTTVMVRLLQAGVEVLGEDGISTNASHPSDNVRQLIQEAIAPLQAQLEEVRKIIHLQKREANLIAVEELNLSERAYNNLKRAQIHTIADLMKLSYEELLERKNFGVKSADEVKDKLFGLGFALPPGEVIA